MLSAFTAPGTAFHPQGWTVCRAQGLPQHCPLTWQGFPRCSSLQRPSAIPAGIAPKHGTVTSPGRASRGSQAPPGTAARGRGGPAGPAKRSGLPGDGGCQRNRRLRQRPRRPPGRALPPPLTKPRPALARPRPPVLPPPGPATHHGSRGRGEIGERRPLSLSQGSPPLPPRPPPPSGSAAPAPPPGPGPGPTGPELLPRRPTHLGPRPPGQPQGRSCCGSSLAALAWERLRRAPELRERGPAVDAAGLRRRARLQPVPPPRYTRVSVVC